MIKSRLMNILMLSAIIWLTACSDKADWSIEEEKMVRILADLNISDQIIRKYPAVYRDSIREVLTQSLLEIHNISQGKLDTNLYLYQTDLEKYKAISEQVLMRLEAMKNEPLIKPEILPQ